MLNPTNWNEETIYKHFEHIIENYFGPQMKTDRELCCKIWSSLANVDWYYIKNANLLRVSYSWRAAGSLIARIIERGDYMDWYCSGDPAQMLGEFRLQMKKHGFVADDLPTICDEPDCLKAAVAGFPTDDGQYRMTCSQHCNYQLSQSLKK